MNLPKSVKVGPFTYLVTERDPRELGEDGDTNGYTVTNRSEIVVAPHLSAGQQRCVLLHETLHAVWDLAGLPGEQEEETVRRMDAALLSVLRENPKLVAFLLEK